jgi:hypothetical protein
MVVDDAATILAYRSRTGKRRVHFINLLVPMPSPGVAVGGLSLTLSLRGHGRARDWLPDLKSLTPLLEVFGGGEPVAFRSEVLADGTIREEKTLRVR